MFINDTLSKLNFCIWSWAKTANQKQTEKLQTQNADGTYALFVLYMTQLEVMSQQ